MLGGFSGEGSAVGEVVLVVVGGGDGEGVGLALGKASLMEPVPPARKASLVM